MMDQSLKLSEFVDLLIPEKMKINELTRKELYGTLFPLTVRRILKRYFVSSSFSFSSDESFSVVSQREQWLQSTVILLERFQPER